MIRGTIAIGLCLLACVSCTSETQLSPPLRLDELQSVFNGVDAHIGGILRRVVDHKPDTATDETFVFEDGILRVDRTTGKFEFYLESENLIRSTGGRITRGQDGLELELWPTQTTIKVPEWE